MTQGLRRGVLALCWLAIVGGALLFAAGAYTGYVEGVAADEERTVGRLMPAEVAAFVLGLVLAITGGTVAAALRGSRTTVADAH
ncbi:hypothetical protein EQW78_13725 [Oerskovia turbata]|uniref:Uncharacterized protein n=1 Tax=Oerskovia turbata TaxID=1713 RepID=A0A4Q1KTP8_9CELL|nr:hypothetical protein [Oerskovia turbata]RXR25270.1 hypothetical protein EQW73_10460 [Oerskovia turbata]RXR32789.1 hypothetical protein EQW78_13725 [Oerskovia turbata]TGJ95531.1 hypothetical protein DLJ96_13405 [Actinotalea fermentans ATCC 43279 = JCM 9966 = DSM 3133]